MSIKLNILITRHIIYKFAQKIWSTYYSLLKIRLELKRIFKNNNPHSYLLVTKNKLTTKQKIN